MEIDSSENLQPVEENVSDPIKSIYSWSGSLIESI